MKAIDKAAELLAALNTEETSEAATREELLEIRRLNSDSCLTVFWTLKKLRECTEYFERFWTEIHAEHGADYVPDTWLAKHGKDKTRCAP
jgi:hypothetical protein